MKFPRCLFRDEADPVALANPVALAERMACAIANAEMTELKRLVARDFHYRGAGRSSGQLPGRDRLLQFVHSLRRDSARFKAQGLKVCVLDVGAEFVHATIRVYWQMKGFFSDEPIEIHTDYWWTFFFSRHGKLIELRVHDLNADDAVHKYPALTRAHIYRSGWNQFCDATSNVWQTFVRLRALTIVTFLFGLLMLVPSQTGEALRVIIQDQIAGGGVPIYTLGLLCSTVSFGVVSIVYGLAVLATRRTNEQDTGISVAEWTMRLFLLLCPFAAFCIILSLAAWHARLNPRSESADIDSNLLDIDSLLLGVSIGTLLFGLMSIVILFKFVEAIAFENSLYSKLPDRAISRMMLLLTLVALAGYFVFWSNSPVPTSVVAWSSLALMVLAWLALLATKTRFPFVFTALAVPLALSWLNLNHHHVIRFREMKTPAPAMDAAFAFTTWARERQSGPDSSLPVFIVAAEGGGMRAGVMTAMVLDELRARYPRFLERLFVVVGVSGGSVGAASFAAAVHDPGKIPPNWQATLHSDFLAPSVGALLGGDLLARYVPRAFVDLSRWDRSRALEDAWSDGWKTATGTDALRNLWFSDLFPRPNSPQPYLVLMTTSVEDGEPMAISHLCNFSMRTLAGIRPKLDVPLTTAAIMSARFPVVSSVALLPDSRPPVGFVDGGYYENSGLTAALRLIRAIQGRGNQGAPVSDYDCPNRITTESAKITSRIIVIRIENGAAESEQQSANHMFEWLSPMSALYAGRAAHGKEAARNLKDLIDASKKAECAGDPASPSIDEVTFRLGAAKVPIPLGWVLSSVARKEIADQLNSESNALAFAKVGSALGVKAARASGEQCGP
jgi:Patatin-like phospholipase